MVSVSADGVYYDWFDFLLAKIIVSRLRQPIKLLRIDNFRHKDNKFLRHLELLAKAIRLLVRQ